MTTHENELDPMTVPVALRRELLLDGWHDKAIRRQVTSGAWTKVRHGAYVDTASWRRLTDAGRHLLAMQCVLRSADTALVVSHTTAAVLWGAPTWRMSFDDVHVTRLDGRIGRREAGVHQHCGAIAEGDVVRHRGVAVMSPTRVALEVTTRLPVDAAVGVVSHLLHQRLTTPEQLARRYSDEEHPLTQWPGSRPTDLVLRLSSPLFESLGEARTFHLMFRQHLPLPEAQLEIRDASGRVIARLDFAWPELGAWLEFDGRVKYEKLLRPGESASDVVVREKEREDLVRRLTGWRCIRVTWRDLEDPERLAETIRSVLFPAMAA